MAPNDPRSEASTQEFGDGGDICLHSIIVGANTRKAGRKKKVLENSFETTRSTARAQFPDRARDIEN